MILNIRQSGEGGRVYRKRKKPDADTFGGGIGHIRIVKILEHRRRERQENNNPQRREVSYRLYRERKVNRWIIWVQVKIKKRLIQVVVNEEGGRNLLILTKTCLIVTRYTRG